MMARALYKLPNMNMGKCVFYMNRAAHAGLAIQAMDRSNGVLNVQQSVSQFGTPHSWLTYLGVPIRCCDAILNTETLVTA
ncbi:MAG: phage major capsid protein, partial [bacterium]